MDESTGWCEGCLRTLNEIAEWSTLDDVARRAVCKLLPPRRHERERRAAAHAAREAPSAHDAIGALSHPSAAPRPGGSSSSPEDTR